MTDEDRNERIRRRQLERFRLLQHVYDQRLDGQTYFEVHWAARNLGIGIDAAIQHANHLLQEGLIDLSMGGAAAQMRLTHRGEVEVEQVTTGHATPHFPVHIQNYINVERMEQSQIQQGTQASTQNLTVNPNPEEFASINSNIADLLREMRERLPELGLDAAGSARLNTHIETADVQLRSEQPDPGVLRSVLRVAGGILQGTTANVAAEFLKRIEPVQRTLESLGP